MAKAEEEQSRRIDDLVRRLDSIADVKSREIAQGLIEAILELHGAGLERVMELLFDSGESGKTAIRRLAADKLVSSLLVLHGLHPDDMETRVIHAVAKGHFQAELIGIFEGTVRVRLTGSGCGLKDSVEAALREAIPDAEEIIVEEIAPQNNFVPLASLGNTVQIA